MHARFRLPEIIQGGMGIAVSHWGLARAVAALGGLGVVSGTALDVVMVRRLQLGDPDGSQRRALGRFPDREMADWILQEYFVEGGLAEGAPFKPLPLFRLEEGLRRSRLLIAAAFCEVSLAREDHEGSVGINLLEKIQLPTLETLWGAMLAGVGFVIMGGGIPMSIPGVLDGLVAREPVEIKLQVENNRSGPPAMRRLDPSAHEALVAIPVQRPQFLPIISSDVLAKTLVRRANGKVDGFIVEHYSAGGHNAPPRQARGESPAYGPKDEANLEVLRELGLPFWLAGSYASPAGLARALAMGANGIQVGTAFAYCRDSGIDPGIRQKVLLRQREGLLTVRTDFRASPTGYPFKVAEVPEFELALQERDRVCDLGYLREIYAKEGGELAFRCPAEPVSAFLARGGSEADTIGRLCLCNGLLATIGLGQRRHGATEPPLITSGDDFSFLPHLLGSAGTDYSAADVMAYLRSEPPVPLDHASSAPPAVS